MKKLTFALCIFQILSFSSCKKTDASSPTQPKHGKSPIQYLQFSGGVDGLLILSTATNKGWVLTYDSLGNNVWLLDSIIHKDEINCYFPSNTENQTLNDAGTISYNWHDIEKDQTFDYLELTFEDSFFFSSGPSAFSSDWHVQGTGTLPGFVDINPNDYFPTDFKFNIDSVIHKNSAYTITLNTGSGIAHADSLVFMIYDLMDPSIMTYKVTSPGNLITTFNANDLSIFSEGEVVSIDVVAYNYRKMIKNGSQNMYFINQKRFDNKTVIVRP